MARHKQPTTVTGVPAVRIEQPVEIQVTAAADPAQILASAHERAVDEAQLRLLVRAAKAGLKSRIDALTDELAAAEREGVALSSAATKIFKETKAPAELVKRVGVLEKALKALDFVVEISVEVNGYTLEDGTMTFAVITKFDRYSNHNSYPAVPLPRELRAAATRVAAQETHCESLRARLKTLHRAMADSRAIEEEGRSMIDLKTIQGADDASARATDIKAALAAWLDRVDDEARRAALQIEDSRRKTK